MDIGKAQTRLIRDKIDGTDSALTATLNAGNTVATIELGVVARQITLQATGDLAGTFTVSANGSNFVTGGSLAAANGLATYNSNSVKVVQITRSGGSGTVTILVSP